MLKKKNNCKNEIFCNRIISILSKIKIIPIKSKIDAKSFIIVTNYAKGELEIKGNVSDIRNKEISFTNKIDKRVLVLRKNDCSLKNISNILITIYAKEIYLDVQSVVCVLNFTMNMFMVL